MSYDLDGCEPFEYFKEHWRKARIEHDCTICHQRIKPGHHYMDIRCRFDGESESVKRCDRCQAIYKHLQEKASASTDDLVVAFKLDCGETYKGEWGREPPDEIAALAFAFSGENSNVPGV